MRKERNVLAPRGFPWRPIVAGLVTALICATIALNLVGMHSTGGAWLVSSLIGIGVFSATLG